LVALLLALALVPAHVNKTSDPVDTSAACCRCCW
jgi:hypothetical protein